MNERDLIPGSLFTTNGKDVWELDSYYTVPSCKLRNIRTGEVKDFGLGGLIAQDFKRIKMPEE